MKNNLELAAIVIFMALVFGGLIYWQVSIWQECRQNNSFGYCLNFMRR